MARKFFFVCAWLFLLALTWHLGARSAGSQEKGLLYAAEFGDQVYAVDFDFRFRSMDKDGGSVQVWGHAIPALSEPRSATVTGGVAYVVTADGNVYRAAQSESWVITGNFFTGATPIERRSLGQIKARYGNGGSR